MRVNLTHHFKTRSNERNVFVSIKDIKNAFADATDGEYFIIPENGVFVPAVVSGNKMFLKTIVINPTKDVYKLAKRDNAKVIVL